METIKSFIRQHKSIYLALYVPIYLLMFFAVERLVPTSGYWVSYVPLDDAIPFCEYFVPFYCAWYFLLIAVGFALLIVDDRNFRLYMYCLMIGFTASLVFCFIFPNGQDLRPAVFEQQNFFADWVQLIYRADTNTNVLPSMHVIGAMVACFGIFHSKKLRQPWVRIGVVVLTVLINASTVLVKQHSILDVLAGFAASAVVYLIVYGIIAKHMKSPTPQDGETASDSACPTCVG